MLILALFWIPLISGGYSPVVPPPPPPPPVAAAPPATGYGGYVEVKKNPFLIEGTPHCAKGGLTYCEKIDTYPMERIELILYQNRRKYIPFIKSETDTEFVPPKKYGPYGPPSTLRPHPYDTYYPPQDEGGYLPPKNLSLDASYYRKRQPTGYDYSYNINMGVVLPPLLHSMWWNHRDNNNIHSYPHIVEYQQQWRRKKRQALGDEINTLCPVSRQFIKPVAAMAESGRWMYVLNMNTQQYEQLVSSEICRNGPDTPCSGLCSVAPGSRATCRQNHVKKRLVALDGTGNLETEIFWLPHGCECEVNRI